MIRAPQRLRQVLAEPRRLGRALSRHCYGMTQWVDILGAKLASFPSLEERALVARLVADNARHAILFRDRARELGEEPMAYRASSSGQRIYQALSSLTEPLPLLAYAWGSLTHFAALLTLYRSVADEGSLPVIEAVEQDVGEHLRLLEQHLQAVPEEERRRVEEVKAMAEALYADREEEEVEWYGS